MSDETSVDRPEEPYWAERMRAAGFTVRVGTGTKGLGYPEVSFHDFDEPHRGFRQRIREWVADLWGAVRTLKRRSVHR